MSLPLNDPFYVYLKRWTVFYRVFGMAPFSFVTCPHQLHVACRLRDRVAPTLWLLCIFTYVGIICWQWTYYMHKYSLKDIFLYSVYEALLGTTVATIFTPSLTTKTPSITLFFPKIAAADKAIKSGAKRKKVLPYVLSFIIIEVALIVTVMTLEIFRLRPKGNYKFYSLIFVSEGIMYSLITLDYSQFLLMTLFLKRRYKAMNNQLSQSIENKLYLNPLTFQPHIQDLRQAYARLYEASKLLGHHYGLPVSLGCLWCFACLLKSIGSALRTDNPSVEITSDVGWALITVSLLSVTCGVCDTTIRQAFKTQVLIQKLLLNKMEDEMEEELELFSREASIMRPRFTVREVLEINLSLLTSAIAAAATYILAFAQIP